jgi:hypothetical protein
MCKGECNISKKCLICLDPFHFPFQWVPEPPPPKKKSKKAKKSLLSGFGASSVVYEDIDDGVN